MGQENVDILIISCCVRCRYGRAVRVTTNMSLVLGEAMLWQSLKSQATGWRRARREQRHPTRRLARSAVNRHD